MNQLFNFNGNDVRTVNRDGEPQFVLKDVCEVLDLASRVVRQRLSDDVCSTYPIPDALGRPQDTTLINEDGLYDVILESRKPEAKAFRKWITSEVIPTIRKTGSYGVQHQLPQTMIEAVESYLIEMKKNVQLESEKQQLAIENTAQKQQLKDQETPIAIYNLAIAAKNTMSMQEASKALGTGRTRMYEFLRDESIVMKGSTLPYQRFIDAGYFKVTERPRASGDTIVNDPATRVTAKGFDYIARLMQKRTGEGA